MTDLSENEIREYKGTIIEILKSVVENLGKRPATTADISAEPKRIFFPDGINYIRIALTLDAKAHPEASLTISSQPPAHESHFAEPPMLPQVIETPGPQDP